jgi:hypothetical protein
MAAFDSDAHVGRSVGGTLERNDDEREVQRMVCGHPLVEWDRTVTDLR